MGVSAPVSRQSTDASAGHACAVDEAADLLAAVSGQEQKAPEPLREVDLDHVPEDRAAADLDHRLGQRRCPALQARPAATAQDHNAGSHGGGLSGIITPRMSEPVNPAIFKAYDIRGVYGDEIDRETAVAIGRSFARVIAELEGKPTGELRLGLGRDMRLTSPELAEAYREGICDEGATVLDAGEVGDRGALFPGRLA